MAALDELLLAWRQDPNAELTVRLCAELDPAARPDTIREVGASAETWHGHDASVMLAVGGLYLRAGLLTEAQVSLVSAGKLDPHSPTPFRLLGEVLLRRGDAIRAEKVLARALELGAEDPASRSLHERAEALISLQKRSGAAAVAREAVRLLSARPPASSRGPSAQRAKPAPSSRAKPAPSRPARGELVEISEVHELSVSSGARARAPEPSSEDITHLVRDENDLPSFDDVSAVELVDDADFSSFEPVTSVAPSSLPPAQDSVRALPPAPARSRASAAPAQSAPARAVPAPAPARRAPEKPPHTALRAAAAPTPLPRPTPFEPALPSFDRDVPPDSAAPAPRFDESIEPSAALVLEQLARVGVFEPAGSVRPAWEAPPLEKTRGVVPLVLAIVLLAAGGGGAYELTRRAKIERAEQASALSAEVEKLLRAGRPKDLRTSDEKLGRVFDLDSRSPRAARLWLQNRVLGALLLGEEPRGIDSAVHRGRAVGLSEKDLAAGRIASFLVDGDLAGAAALLPKWDRAAGSDAAYQLVAGAVLERAGDERALERYAAAARLDPKLVPADVLLARLLLLEYGVERARPAIDALRAEAGDTPMLRALEALAWVVDAERPEVLPDAARLSAADAAALPAPLAAVPAMVEAASATARGELAAAARALDRAVDSAAGPVIAASLGYLALETGDEQLARKAALRALSFASLYPRARTLAARVALLGGRLDDAEKAVEELDAKAPAVAVVHSVVAYETGAPRELASALRALDSERSSASLAALRASSGVLLGTEYPSAQQLEALASPLVSWGQIVALDAALDNAQLALAEKLIARRDQPEASPARALRAARLARYQKQTEQALAASDRAFQGKPTSALVIERVYELLDAGRPDDAEALVAKYPAVLGSSSEWLGALIDASSKELAPAAARLKKLELPADDGPVVARVLAGRALAAGRDPRARAYVFRLAKRLGRHPDVILAAVALK